MGRLTCSILVSTLLCLALLGTEQALAQGTLTVTSTGLAAILGDVGRARDEALRDAQRRAVEQALGAAIEGRTLMINLQVVEDRVLGQADGFVRSYQVLNEVQERDAYRVEIRAVVDTGLVSDDLEGFGALLRLALGNPRVLVLVIADEAGLERSLTQSLIDFLVARQFFVVSAEQLAALRTLHRPYPLDELATLARTVEADLVLTATASVTANQIERTRSTLYSARGELALQAILASTGQIIASTSGSVTRAHANPISAQRDALTLALDQSAGPFILETVRVLNTTVSDLGTPTSIRLVITNLPDFNTLQIIRTALAEVRGVATVQQRRFEGGTGTLDVQGHATIDEIATRLTSIASPTLQVTLMDGQRLELSVKP